MLLFQQTLSVFHCHRRNLFCQGNLRYLDVAF